MKPPLESFQDLEMRIQELEASRDHANRLYELAPVSYFTLSRQGAILSVNVAGANLIGFERSHLLTLEFGQLVAPHDRPRLVDFLNTVFTREGKATCEVTVLKSDLESVFARVEGVVSGTECLTALIDITERKRIESRLQESEERFRHLLENIPSIAVQGYDSQRRVIFWNSASQVLYGYTPEEARGRCLEDLIIPQQMRAGVVAAVDAWLQSDVPIPAGELVLVTKAGKPVHVFSSHCMQVNSRGESEMFCVDIDLTEQKRLEEQLRHSQKMEAVGQLAGGVAHDLNNILTVILGYCEFLRMGCEDDPDRCGDIDKVSASAGRAANLTRSLLAFSRKEPVTCPRSHDLNEIVTSVEDFLVRIIGEDVRLEFSCSSEPLLVEVDRGHIEQVVINLATNARDAMPKGGVLKVSTCGSAHPDQPGHYAMLSVTDTGCGMDDETRGRIFEPFYTTKGVGKGTGLGLSIVYGIVKQHRGFISVRSVLDQGTTFCLYLPLGKVQTSEPESGADEVISRPGSGTILVVEDDADVRKVVETVLKMSGYKVIVAVDGADGVAQFTAHREAIGLVVMDVIMPGMNGLQAADRIRQLEPDSKILFVSGYTSDLLHSRADFVGSYEIIEKPVSPPDLLRRVRALLGDDSSEGVLALAPTISASPPKAKCRGA